MSNIKNNNILGITSAFSYCFLTVIMGIITKLIYKNNIDVYICFFICCFISTIFLGLCIFIKNKNFSQFKLTKKQFLYSLFIGGFIFVFATKFCLFNYIQYIYASIQKPIVASQSLITIILTTILNRKFPNKDKIVNYLLVLMGILLIIYDVNLDFF